MTTSCFIAMGSNLDQQLTQVQQATAELAAHTDIELVTVSPWYQSTAIGPGEQDDYINGVAEINTTLAPLTLLAALQTIENLHHRQRLQRWGPRTLDLDLLLYGNQLINHPQLVVPHPYMLERNFVIYPLFDIAADLTLPDGSTLLKQQQRCASDGLHLVATR